MEVLQKPDFKEIRANIITGLKYNIITKLIPVGDVVDYFSFLPLYSLKCSSMNSDYSYTQEKSVADIAGRRKTLR